MINEMVPEGGAPQNRALIAFDGSGGVEAIGTMTVDGETYQGGKADGPGYGIAAMYADLWPDNEAANITAEYGDPDGDLMIQKSGSWEVKSEDVMELVKVMSSTPGDGTVWGDMAQHVVDNMDAVVAALNARQ